MTDQKMVDFSKLTRRKLRNYRCCELHKVCIRSKLMCLEDVKTAADIWTKPIAYTLCAR